MLRKLMLLPVLFFVLTSRLLDRFSLNKVRSYLIQKYHCSAASNTVQHQRNRTMITTTTKRIMASRVLSRASAAQIPLVFSHHFAPAPHCCPQSMKMASTSTATSKSMPARTCIGNACRTFLTITDTNEEPTNPLTELKEMALAKNLCDQNGFRVPDKHWAFVLSAHDISSHKVRMCLSVHMFG